MALILTIHARQRMLEYAIDEAWVERTVNQPEHTEPDPDDAALTRTYRRIPERGGRILRVVYRPDGSDIVVVTVHFDRGARRWLR